MFTGLSAFPLTPLVDDVIDERAFAGLIERLVDAEVDSITALGSTGSYAFLSLAERARVARLAVEQAGSVPVLVGIGALRTSDVLRAAEDAQDAGAAGLLLAPVSYQALTADDVFGLYEEVSAAVDLPIVVYDNPGTTHFAFTDELYAAVARLPRVASIKVPPLSADPTAASARLQALRALVPADVTIGVSGDVRAAGGLNAGADAWYSVIAGTLPAPAVAISRAAQSGDADAATALAARLAPLWALFDEHGSLRVTAAVAEELGLVRAPSLPRPIRGLDATARDAVRSALTALGV
ncbi:dihydrodipicolinate synthase family protein [Microbacterium sp. NPDC089695]|uniref:dihydrodipicolinate synthase family protein n=1 Tax=Microbacterium sp. NPDC089695 TaxID=3364198 RepID=UPI00380223A9